jgi:hypothetical protein
MHEPQRPAIFKWRHFAPEIILCAVRWYLCYSLSYRDVQELFVERGSDVDQRTRPLLKPTNKSWRVDKTYVRVKGRWFYLYRAIDSAEATIDFFLSPLRSADQPKRCLPRRWRFRPGRGASFSRPGKRNAKKRCRQSCTVGRETLSPRPISWLRIPAAAIRIICARCTTRWGKLRACAQVSNLARSSGDKRIEAALLLMKLSITPDPR